VIGAERINLRYTKQMIVFLPSDGLLAAWQELILSESFVKFPHYYRVHRRFLNNPGNFLAVSLL
jgi:hypothetical protein